MNDKRHVYEYEVDPTSESAPANVVRLVGKQKRVLEVGCGPGSITKVLAQEGECRVTGLELDIEAIKKVSPYCETIIQADLNSADWPVLLEGIKEFDVVVAADVLEHLYDPWSALRSLSRLINSDGYLVISLPHVGHAAIMSCLYNGDFEYRDWGLLDRTHIRFFCLKNIEEMFSKAGLKIIDARYVTMEPEETEFAGSWGKLPDTVKAVLKTPSHANVYQVVIKSVPFDFPGDALRLIPEKKDSRKTVDTKYLKKWLSSKLSTKMKQRIRSLFGLVGVKI